MQTGSFPNVRVAQHTTLRVQVPSNHILTQNMYYNYTITQTQVPNYWVLGPSGQHSGGCYCRGRTCQHGAIADRRTNVRLLP